MTLTALESYNASREFAAELAAGLREELLDLARLCEDAAQPPLVPGEYLAFDVRRARQHLQAARGLQRKLLVEMARANAAAEALGPARLTLV